MGSPSENIFSSDSAIGSFNSFGNAAGEVINSIQASANNTALFRVTGTEPSMFFGALNANCHIFLINPNGILFGSGSQVNAPGLVASTLDISNNDFLKSQYLFQQNSSLPPGYILNQGDLTAQNAGFVALIGGAVKNEGSIHAENGSIALLAGGSVTLSLDGDGFRGACLVEIRETRGRSDPVTISAGAVGKDC